MVSAFIFLGFLLNPSYLPAIIAIIVIYAVMLITFWLWGRHRLIMSPEEEYALSGGLDVVDLDDLVAHDESDATVQDAAAEPDPVRD